VEGFNEYWKLLELTWKRYRRGKGSLVWKEEGRTVPLSFGPLDVFSLRLSVRPTLPVLLSRSLFPSLSFPFASRSASLTFCRCSKSLQTLLELSRNAFPQLPRFVSLPLLQLLRRFVSLYCTQYAYFCSKPSLGSLQATPE